MVRTKADLLPLFAQEIMLGVKMGRSRKKKKHTSLTGREGGYFGSARVLGGVLFDCVLEQLFGSDYLVVVLWSLPAA